MATTAPKRPRGRPRDPSVNGRVLRAARELVAELGVVGASMSAIADRTGIGKPTIYLRWPNRAALLEQAAGQALEEAPLEVVEALADARDAVDRLLRHPDGRFLVEAMVMPSTRVRLGEEV